MKNTFIILATISVLFSSCTTEDRDFKEIYFNFKYLNETGHVVHLGMLQYFYFDQTKCIESPCFAFTIREFDSVSFPAGTQNFLSGLPSTFYFVFDDEKRLDYHIDVDESKTPLDYDSSQIQWCPDSNSPLSEKAYEREVIETPEGVNNIYTFRITEELYQQAK